jgi:hypothetical protein
MIRAQEIQETKTAIELTLPPTDPRPRARVAELAVSLPVLETDGIILSGSQVLWSCFSALSFMALVLWAILKLWVYE